MKKTAHIWVCYECGSQLYDKEVRKENGKCRFCGGENLEEIGEVTI